GPGPDRVHPSDGICGAGFSGPLHGRRRQHQRHLDRLEQPARGRQHLGQLVLLRTLAEAVLAVGQIAGNQSNIGVKHMTCLLNLWNDEQGQDLIEYTLLMAFVALASAALFMGAGASIKGIWSVTNSQLAAAYGSSS